jgi:hypothetical protein
MTVAISNQPPPTHQQQPSSSSFVMLAHAADPEDWHRPRAVTISSSCASSTTSSFEEQLSFTRTSKRPQQRVHFAATSIFSIIPSKSTQELQSSWYTDDDTKIFKASRSFSSLALRESSCARAMECLVISLAANKTTADSPAAAYPPMDNVERAELIRGIEHSVSPVVLKYVTHRRNVHMRKVLREQAKLRHQHHQHLDDDMLMMNNEDDMVASLAQCSMKSSAFAREWAKLKLFP